MNPCITATQLQTKYLLNLAETSITKLDRHGIASTAGSLQAMPQQRRLSNLQMVALQSGRLWCAPCAWPTSGRMKWRPRLPSSQWRCTMDQEGRSATALLCWPPTMWSSQHMTSWCPRRARVPWGPSSGFHGSGSLCCAILWL